MAQAEHFDVLVVGAGLSGIDAGYRLQTRCPRKRYVILEARANLGGTWDLFRYPGVRSDSDMFTLGYPFRPWREARAIADGPSILRYLHETAREFGINRHIRFNHRVVSAGWSSRDACWTVDALVGEANEAVRFTCNFLYLCSGYYRYDEGFAPRFPGAERFTGRVVHPQHWPEDLDYAGKRIVVIGSGATAITLVPAMAAKAAHVTMLQRSPTYVIALPAKDRNAERLTRVFPNGLGYALVRWKNILISLAFFQLCRRRPALARRLIRDGALRFLPADYPVDVHFNPRYRPWEQRLCVAPNGDLFRALRRGRASVVTDEIEAFTERGIRLVSGNEIEADIIVTATGLKLLPLGGIQISVDGEPVNAGETVSYKGVMLSGVPNLAVALGYVNASWTLKADLTSIYVCRLLNYMERHGFRQCTPRYPYGTDNVRPLLDLSSGYILRAAKDFPKQGVKRPWRLYQNYLLDLLALRFGAINDGALELSQPKLAPLEERLLGDAVL